MNILLEKRANVLQSIHNTAQTQIVDILETYSKTATTLHIREPLHGDIDFTGILAGFGNISAILFAEGEITSIAGLPAHLAVLECPGNLLIDLPTELPKTLSRLQLARNSLSKLDLDNLPKLTVLNVAENKIKEVGRLPASLVELNLSHNQLSRLNLAGIRQLSLLNVSHNPITVVENLAAPVAEIIMDNTPTIDFRYLAPDAAEQLVPSLRQSTRNSTTSNDGMTYKEALDIYFRIKSKYEFVNHELRRDLFESMNAITNRAARRETRRKIATLKPKCVQCRRPVGTLFSKKNNHYTAVCGDTTHPCSLHIDLFNGQEIPLTSALTMFKEDMDEIKTTIIEQKMDILFQYMAEDKCVSLFTQQMNLLEEDTKIYSKIVATYKEVFDNEFTKTSIMEKKRQLFSATEQSADLLAQYKTTGNREFLKESMQIQVNEILPVAKMIRTLENEVVEMAKKRRLSMFAPREYFLFKYPAQLSKIGYNSLMEPERIVKWSLEM